MKTVFWFLALAALARADLSVAERAQAFLAPGPDVRLATRGKMAETTMPSGPWRWNCTILSGLDCPNPRVRVEVAGQDGKRSWVVAFDKQVRVTQKVTLHPLAPGTPLSEADFQVSELWLPANQLQGPAYSGPFDSRYRVRRSLPAQSFLPASAVEAVPYCEPGCRVDVHVQQPGLALTLSGKSLERGYPDRPLRVRLENGGTMQAWYDKDGQLSDRRTP